MTSGRTDAFDQTPVAPSNERGPWKRSFHHIKFVVVVLCATSILMAGSDRVYAWLFPSDLEGAASRDSLAGRAIFGAVMIVAGLAALAYAVKSEMELKKLGKADKPRVS